MVLLCLMPPGDAGIFSYPQRRSMPRGGLLLLSPLRSEPFCSHFGVCGGCAATSCHEGSCDTAAGGGSSYPHRQGGTAGESHSGNETLIATR